MRAWHGASACKRQGPICVDFVHPLHLENQLLLLYLDKARLFWTHRLQIPVLAFMKVLQQCDWQLLAHWGGERGEGAVLPRADKEIVTSWRRDDNSLQVRKPDAATLRPPPGNSEIDAARCGSRIFSTAPSCIMCDAARQRKRTKNQRAFIYIRTERESI